MSIKLNYTKQSSYIYIQYKGNRMQFKVLKLKTTLVKGLIFKMMKVCKETYFLNTKIIDFISKS